MANQRGRPPIGERNEPARPNEYVKALSSIDPLPYFPNLARQLRGPTNAVVLTYLEMCHPSPQDQNEPQSSRSRAPVIIDCDQVCEDLQIARRTLHVALHCLATWYLTEDLRGRAERAGRAFLNFTHSTHGSIKFYSIVGPRGWYRNTVLSLKRNMPHLQTLLETAFPSTYGQSPVPQNVEVCAPIRSVLSLPAILAKVMPDWGNDRRGERWERWRRENGRKPTNVSRMRDAKKSVSSSDQAASGDIYKDADAPEVEF